MSSPTLDPNSSSGSNVLSSIANGASKVAGKVIGAIPQAVGAVAGAVPQLANTVANSGSQEATDSVTAKQGPGETAGQGVQATQQLNPSTQEANLGLQQAGEISRQVGSPVAGAVTQSALGSQQQSAQQATQATANYQQAVSDTNQKTLDAEKAIQQTAAAAKIDPQAYLHSLGTSGKVMTAIGMALSGIGSGLTGQPNMAMQIYQANTDRAIAAQQQLYTNLMTNNAQRLGLIQSAQDRQTISSNAYNAAVMSVMQGNNTAIQAVSEQAKYMTQPQAAQQLINQNNIRYQQAIDSHNRDYINTIQSGDQRKVNLLGAVAAPVVDHLTGSNVTPPRTPAQQRVPSTSVPQGLGSQVQPFPTSRDPNQPIPGVTPRAGTYNPPSASQTQNPTSQSDLIDQGSDGSIGIGGIRKNGARPAYNESMDLNTPPDWAGKAPASIPMGAGSYSPPPSEKKSEPPKDTSGPADKVQNFLMKLLGKE